MDNVIKTFVIASVNKNNNGQYEFYCEDGTMREMDSALKTYPHICLYLNECTAKNELKTLNNRDNCKIYESYIEITKIGIYGITD